MKIVVIAATPGRLKALVEGRGRVEAFLKAGGYLVLNGLTPEGLESFNTLVGFDHMIRPFGESGSPSRLSKTPSWPG